MKKVTTLLILCFSISLCSAQGNLKLSNKKSNDTISKSSVSPVFYSDVITEEYTRSSQGFIGQSTRDLATINADYNSTLKLGDAPFSCGDGLAYILTNTGSSNGNITGLYSYNLSTSVQTLIKYPLIPSNGGSQFVNSIGYNVLDNHLYGLLIGTNNIVKIDQTGAIEYLTIAGAPIGNYSSGDVSENGVLYLYGGSKFISINLNPSAPDYLTVNILLNYSNTINDLVFSPVDNNIYMMTSNGQKRLLRFNVSNNTITDLGAITGLVSETSNSFGTAFMDNMGNMYISNNGSGNVYKIALPQSGGLTATFFNSLTGNPGDGARCPNQVIPPNAVKDQICATSDANVLFNVTLNDIAGTNALDVSSVQLIDPVSSASSTSVTIAGQGTFTVDVSGVVTFSPLASFTQTSVQYTIADVDGFRSVSTTINVSTIPTAAPTGLSTQEFCASLTPTIADLVVSGTAIKWYNSLSSTTPLPASTPLADQTTYYASQSSSFGCESANRLEVTAVLNSDVTLVSQESTSCSADRRSYTIEATFTGKTPFTAVGTGAPGVFNDNGDGTSTWTSSAINFLVTSYNVEIKDGNSCNSLVLSGNSPQDCLTVPFDCENGLTYILTNTGTSISNYVTGFYSLNLATNTASLIKYPLVDAASPSRFINAIGYNTLDNFVYGLLQRTNKIARIDAVGNVDYLTITGSFVPGDYAAGDIDQNGNLYLHGDSKFVSINLDASSPNYLMATDLLNYLFLVNDMAFSPIDNNLYMVTSTNNPRLFRFNTQTNTISDLGAVTGLEAETDNSFGTAFMDSMGNMFIANNSSGKTYKITSPNAGGLNAAFYSNAMVGINPGDGARCPNQIIFPAANDVSECVTLESNITINLTEISSEGTYSLNPSSVQLLDPATSLPVNTVTVGGQGTFTVDSSGILTFTPANTFTGTSIQYTIADTMGNRSQPGTVTVYLNTAVVPTGEAVQTFCAFDQPTVASLVASGSNIQWFDSASSTTPLEASTPLVDQMMYYGSQTTDNGCESIERLVVQVVLSTTETPSGSASQVFCETNLPTIANLTATGENIQWYSSLTSATPLDITMPLVDQAIYYASQTIASGCESTGRLEVTVTLTPGSEAPTGEATQTFCASANPTVADLLAVGENIEWFDSATSTTALDVTTPLVDQAVYYATQTISAGCASDGRLVVTVTLTDNTETPMGEALQSFCESAQPTIADLVVSGDNVQWYETAISTTPLDITTPLADQTTYYAALLNESECSGPRFEVTVTLNMDVTLSSDVTTTCSEGGTSYTLAFSVTGTAPFTATGVGAPGVFTENTDGSYTWMSGELNYQSSYSIEIQDANACNTLKVTGSAPENCFQPFECADGLVYILTNTPVNGNVTALYSLDLNSNNLTLIKDPLIEDSTSSQFVNGIGYNVLDNFIYGVLQNTNKMLKISQTGEIDFLTISGGFTAGSYAAGDIDENGIMYLYGQGKFVAINLNPMASDYLQATTLLNYSATINDVAFSPIDNNLYMMTSDGANTLLQFDTTTNTINNLGTMTGLGAENSSSYGTAFVDITGNLYIANNASGRLYKINSPQTGGLAATIYSTALAGFNPGDGARCPNQSINPIAVDDEICIVGDVQVILTVTDNDASGTYPLDLTTVLLIDPITLTPTTSVTIPGQGTFTVDNAGQVTFVPLPTFSGTSVDYTVADTMGTRTNAATISVFLNTTPVPTGTAVQTFCESQNPTVADLVANGENILWYDSATSETALDPTTPLIDDAVYYATQTIGSGCESVDRLEVTVNLNADLTLVSPELATCETGGATYTVTATFTGMPTFTATGTGAPGTWTDNLDDTYTFVSGSIAINTDYTIAFQDANGCNTITLSAMAPICCTFEVTCPTFEDVSVQCYSDLPSQDSYTIEEFEALGNGDGTIGDSPCGVIVITAANSENANTCSQSVVRTYTITAYEDTNQNGVHDADETTILNTQECTQTITVSDTTAPVVVGDFDEVLNVNCDNIPNRPDLQFEDACSTSITVTQVPEVITGDTDTAYQIVWQWIVSDECGNSNTYTQTVNVTVETNTLTYNANSICTLDTPIDLFDVIDGDVDSTGTWSTTSGDATLDGSIFNPASVTELGNYVFTYSVNPEVGCPIDYVVTVNVNDDCVVLGCGENDVVISTTVTPNGDSYNEFFTVTGIEECGFTIELQIFNRWGAKIYDNNNYQNDWNGFASKKSIGSSDKVPTGTYYYIINLKNSGLKPFAGPIYVATK